MNQKEFFNIAVKKAKQNTVIIYDEVGMLSMNKKWQEGLKNQIIQIRKSIEESNNAIKRGKE